MFSFSLTNIIAAKQIEKTTIKVTVIPTIVPVVEPSSDFWLAGLPSDIWWSFPTEGSVLLPVVKVVGGGVVGIWVLPVVRLDGDQLYIALISFAEKAKEEKREAKERERSKED